MGMIQSSNLLGAESQQKVSVPWSMGSPAAPELSPWLFASGKNNLVLIFP
jgi:hypothetical protein